MIIHGHEGEDEEEGEDEDEDNNNDDDDDDDHEELRTKHMKSAFLIEEKANHVPISHRSKRQDRTAKSSLHLKSLENNSM